MGVEFIYFSKPTIIEQDNGIKIELFGFYDRGTRAVARGYIYYEDDKLDIICGYDISKFRGESNV